jgi:hypothetical protein
MAQEGCISSVAAAVSGAYRGAAHTQASLHVEMSDGDIRQRTCGIVEIDSRHHARADHDDQVAAARADHDDQVAAARADHDDQVAAAVVDGQRAHGGDSDHDVSSSVHVCVRTRLLPWLLGVLRGGVIDAVTGGKDVSGKGVGGKDVGGKDVIISTAARLRACNALICVARALVDVRSALRSFTRAVAHPCMQMVGDSDATGIMRAGCLQILFVCVHGLQNDAAPLIRDAMDVAERALKVFNMHVVGIIFTNDPFS